DPVRIDEDTNPSLRAVAVYQWRWMRRCSAQQVLSADRARRRDTSHRFGSVPRHPYAGADYVFPPLPRGPYCIYGQRTVHRRVPIPALGRAAHRNDWRCLAESSAPRLTFRVSTHGAATFGPTVSFADIFMISGRFPRALWLAA